MTNPRQINQGGAQNQERQMREQTGSRAHDDFPTHGGEAQRHREQGQKQKKAEDERRDELGFSKDDESHWG